MTLALHRFPTADAANQALAAAVAADLQRAQLMLERPLLLVSGGRSPIPFFNALVTAPLDWARLDVSLVDDRSVPPDHADSNAQLVAQHLLVGAAQAARWLPLVLPPLPDEDDLALAQRSAQAANANPALAQAAVLVLGVGPDGHTASLFADAPQWSYANSTDERYVALQPGAAPHARVSLSLHALRAQRICYVGSGGAAKMAAIERAGAIAAKVAADELPAQALLDAGPLACLIADPAVTLQVFHFDE